MAEFNIHHDVRQLMKIFSLEDNEQDMTEDVVADRLIKSIHSQKPPADPFVSKLIRNPDFKKIYDDLKSRNIFEVDSTVSLLSRISANEDLKKFLRFHKIIAASSSHSSSKINGECSSGVNVEKPCNDNPSMSHHSQPVCPPAGDTSDATTRTAISTSTKGKDDKKGEVKRRPRRHFDKRDWSFLSFDYKTIDWSREEPPKPLSSMSIYEQESALVQDLLHVLVGIEGKYIRLQPTPDSSKKNILVVDDQADKLLKTLACKIIAICPMYSSVVHFADENDHGLVNQALAAAMRGVIKDYFTFVAQLESQFRKRCLTMQKMWYYI